METISLCIPRMFKSISRHKIKKVMDEMQLGKIDYIDIHFGKNYQKVFVYFKAWHDTSFAQSIKQRIKGGEELKIIYDDPWFWKCSLNRSRIGQRYNNISHTQRAYVSKYNTSNQLIAMKKLLDKQRVEFSRDLEEKDREIKRLNAYISACMGNNSFLKKKRQAQGKYLKKYSICESAGILFS